MSCGREAFRVLQQGLFVSSLASQFIDGPNLTPSRAVQIENTTRRNFKDLEGMQGNAKALKRNNWERKGILIGPLMAPRFSRPTEIPSQCVSLTVQVAQSASGSNFAAQMASRRKFANMLGTTS